MANENATPNPQGGDLAKLKSMFSDYQKKQSQTKKRKSSEEILAKYFVPRKAREVFRILPPKPGREYIEEAFFHVVSITIAGGKKKHGKVIYCPRHNDPKVVVLDEKGNVTLDGNGNPMKVPAPCPLCDKAKAMLAKQDTSIKGIKKENMNDAQLKINESNKKIFIDANKWEAKKFYILRGIDKGAEKDGVKFWRFKHNFKNQGTLDKLLPVLDAYVNAFQADYTDVKRGTDLTLTMADSEFNGHTYKTLSAVIFGQPSQLHNDPIVIRQWLDDDVNWRDVFLPMKAPNMTPFEFLETVAAGTNPYWDDNDQNNKHWVFPGRPDLEEQANTRKVNLDADEDENFEHASDLNEDGSRITIGNITPENVGTYKEDAVDITAKATPAPAVQAPVAQTQPSVAQAAVEVEDEIEDGITNEVDDDIPESDSGEYDDLPF